MNLLRAEANRQTALEIERHEQAARDCRRDGNTQQAEWHEGKVRAFQEQLDDQRERAIDAAYRNMVAATDRCDYPLAHRYRREMEGLIRERSPGQVAKMEAEKGLQGGKR